MKRRLTRFFDATADGAAPPPETEVTAENTDVMPEQQANTEPAASTEEAATEPPPTPEDITKQIDDKVSEALKVAAMSEEEKKEYQQKQREDALLKREKDIEIRELRANTIKLLGDSGLSADIADVVLGGDMKETVSNIKKFKSVLDSEVQKAVTERLRGKTPAGGNSQAGAADTIKAQFSQGLAGL